MNKLYKQFFKQLNTINPISIIKYKKLIISHITNRKRNTLKLNNKLFLNYSKHIGYHIDNNPIRKWRINNTPINYNNWMKELWKQHNE